jgi:hypothetical protein
MATPKTQLMSSIHSLMMNIKNTDDREKRFEMLESIEILSEILRSVSNFESKLLTDLDVD